MLSGAAASAQELTLVMQKKGLKEAQMGRLHLHRFDLG